jgi:hypothetical protein
MNLRPSNLVLNIVLTLSVLTMFYQGITFVYKKGIEQGKAECYAERLKKRK